MTLNRRLKRLEAKEGPRPLSWAGERLLELIPAEKRAATRAAMAQPGFGEALGKAFRAAIRAKLEARAIRRRAEAANGGTP